MQKLSSNEIKLLRKSGKILKNALSEVILAIKPGISAASLDQIAESSIRQQGGTPSFKNYPPGDDNPFPAALCVSLNDEIVHGIPYPNKIIREGDIVSVDLGVNYHGMNTDMAKSVIAGSPKNKIDEKLIKVTEQALKIAIANAIAGHTTGDIGNAVEMYIKKEGFSVVRALVGHGVGRNVHEDPQIPNFGRKNEGEKLVSGIAVAIEPMVVVGSHDVKTSSDGWSVSTLDGSKAAHFEHTILIGSKRSEIITV
ncbi:MAG: type I methionyl aminopeptidase [Patescibacteria group bacterium]